MAPASVKNKKPLLLHPVETPVSGGGCMSKGSLSVSTPTGSIIRHRQRLSIVCPCQGNEEDGPEGPPGQEVPEDHHASDTEQESHG